MLLEDKSIVIVGGSTGLGLSAARAFSRAGARLVLVGRTEGSLRAAESEISGEVRILCGDAMEESTAAEAIRLAKEAFGRFDGLYHVAGGSGRKWGDGPLHELSLEGWRRTLDLNLTSLFLSNRAAVRQLLEDGTAGSVLNMGSVLGFSPSPHFFSTHAYAATKSAIIGFTRSTAAYYATSGIRVNVLCPALVETPMAQRAAEDATIQAFIRTKQPLEGGRMGRASDLDEAAVYFMSDGSRFTTGQVLSVDGGWSVSEGQLPRGEADA
ncbi:MAG: SDR family NAD(P)-dependent oxidoreductase [Opitutales bacterium]